MFASVLYNLVSYIDNVYKYPVNEIPSAALLTGINMPDHGAQFRTLTKQIRRQITPHVVCLYSQDCQNVKSLVENMIGQFINVTEDQDIEEEVKRRKIKKFKEI